MASACDFLASRVRLVTLALLFVGEHAGASAEQEGVAQFEVQFGVIRTSHQVEIAVAVQVAPGHRMRRAQTP